MASFTIEEIVQAVKGTLLQKGRIDRCSGVSTDTRSIAEGDLFIPLSGENFDGHAFLKQAVSGGAAAVLVSDPAWAAGLPLEVTVIGVEDTRTALEELARFHRLRFSIPVIGITGSNGKTTTKDMVTAVLQTTHRVCHTEKNFNNEIGLSQTLLSLTEEHDACVVEMGMRGFGQIAELCHIACPTAGIVTNVGTSHIGLLGSREGIARAKGELVQALPRSGTAILNGDDEFVRAMGESFSGTVLYYSTAEKASVYADEINFLTEATAFTCHIGENSFQVRLSMLGIHNVYDALAAAAAGSLLHVPPQQIRQALESFRSQSDSQKISTIRGAVVLDDSYNANPLSVEMAFRALRQLKGKRYILLLGDMLELGDYGDRLHYEIGKKAAEMGFDELVTVGPLSLMTAKGAADHGMKQIRCFMTYQEAAADLEKTIGPGDVVLVKGSHAMHLEKVAELWRGDKK